MESDLLNQLQSLAHSQSGLKPEEFIEKAREILFNAVSEILNLEKIISEKKTLLSTLEKDKEDLINGFNEAKNEREQLYDRLVEFDLVRNVELLELKQEIENIKSNNFQTIKERNKFESKYNELKLSYDAVEKESKRLKDSIDKMSAGLTVKTEEIRRLENDVSSLAEELKIRTDENSSLRIESTRLNSLLEEKERETERLLNEAPVAEISENDTPAPVLKELEEQKALLEKRLDETTEETKSLLSTVENLKNNATTLQEERNSFESKVRELENKIALFESQIEDSKSIGEKNKELSEKLEHTKQEFVKLGKEKDRLEQALKEAEATIFSVKSDAEGIKATNESLSEKLGKSEKEASGLRKKAAEDAGSLNKELSGLKEKLASEMEEISALKNNLERMTSLVENKTLEAKQLASEKNIIDSRLDELTEQLMRNRSEKAALETGALKLKDEIAGHKAEIDMLRAKLAVTSEHQKEQENFAKRIEDIVRDVSTIIKEKDDEIKSMKSAYESLNLRLAETVERLERSVSENLAATVKLEQIPNSFYLPAVSEQGRNIHQQKKSWRNNIKWVVLLIFSVFAAFGGWTFYKYDFKDTQKTTLAMQKTSPVQKEPIENPAGKTWPEETQTLRQGNFTITVTPLNPQLINNWGIPLALIETARNNYYLIEIKADEGCIPEEFVKAPSMSFIDEKGNSLRMEDTGLKQNVIYKVNACNGEKGAVFLRHFASLGKGQNPRGIIIKILKEEAPITIK